MYCIKPSKSYSYKVTVPPASRALELPVVKEHLKISVLDTSQDDYLNLLIDAVTQYAEFYTKRTFINTQFLTYRDSFDSFCIELRRSKLQSVERFEYLVDGILTAVDPAIYYMTDETDFSKIALVDNQSWPTNIDCRYQAIQIEFIAGYGDDPSDIPFPLVTGMLAHIAQIYANRGDCSTAQSAQVTCSKCVPRETGRTYDMFRIKDLNTTLSCL